MASLVTPSECEKCGRKPTEKNIGSFYFSTWTQAWQCVDGVRCKRRVERQQKKAAT